MRQKTVSLDLSERLREKVRSFFGFEGGSESIVSADRFSNMEKIGDGRMSTVYRAIDNETRSDVAIKVSHEREAARMAIRNEIPILKNLAHPNIVAFKSSGVLSGGVHDGMLFLATELLRGEDLEVHIERTGKQDWKDVKPVLLGICRALEAVHSSGLVHRDLTPGNVFLSQDGVKLIDFGVAVKRRWLLPDTKFAPGNPIYAAPEAFLMHADPLSDIYSAGMVMYHMLSGGVPSDKAMLEMKMGYGQVDLADLPPGPAAIIKRALERDPDDRFQSASTMRHAIEAVW